MVTRTRAMPTSSAPTTQRMTVKGNNGGYASGNRHSFDSNASHSRTNHHESTTHSQSSTPTTATSNSSNSRRSFANGRNSFRRTLMKRKTNQQQQQQRKGEKGPLLRSSFTSSDENSAATPPPEEREARSSPVTGQAATVPTSATANSCQTPTSSSSPTTVSPEDIPLSHIETVLRVFGDGPSSTVPLDLYRDVLHVSPDSSEREIRIAYFRRGREVLSEGGGVDGATSSPSPNMLDATTRTKFQAVSMAYEILSTPEWKETYLQYGGLIMPLKMRQQMPLQERSFPPLASVAEHEVTNAEQPSSHGPVKVDSRPAPALRSSSYRRSIRKSLLTGKSTLNQRQTSVRWSDHVEELVFDQDPNEHDVEEEENEHKNMIQDFLLIGESEEEEPQKPTSVFSFQDRASPAGESMASTLSTASGRKKKKGKIVIDSEELETHLKRMDNEAEKHFVQDFFDTFEESMDGILSLVDSFGDTPTKTYRPSKKLPQPKPSGFKSRSLFARLGRSMSHDSGDLEAKKEQNHDEAMSSSLAGDDALFKRSKSFPLPTHEESDDSGIVVDSDIMGQSAEINRSSKTSDIAPAPLSRRGLSNPQESPTKRRALPDNAWQIKTETTLTKSVSTQLGSPLSVAQNDTFFRPISPNMSEASDVLTTKSDQFDLESLAMSEMENPFRDATSEDQTISSESQKESQSMESIPVKPVEHSFDNSGDTMATSHVSAPTSLKPKRVNISMVSTAQNIEAQTGVRRVVSMSGPRLSKGSSVGDDVFAGLDEAQARGPAGLRGQSISLQRCNSMKSDCVSELSESVFQYNLNSNPPPAVAPQHETTTTSRMQTHYDRQGADTPVSAGSEVSTATTVTSNIAATPSRRIRFARSSSSLSTRDNPVSGMDLVSAASMGDAVSVHSVDSAVEASGFFEYFVAYVSAIVTECNAMGENGPGFHRDILGLFGEEASVHMERREPPSRTMSSGTSVTSASRA